MPPKTPKELKEQLELEAKLRPQDAPAHHERTAEGLEVRTPTREEYLGNLKKASRPEEDLSADNP